MSETSSCIANRCFETVDGLVATCPRCGSPMWPSRRWRARGWFALVFGTFVGAATAVSLWIAADFMSNVPPAAYEDGIGPGLAKLIIFGIGAIFVALGVTMAVTGVRQIVTGRRNRAGAMIAFALVAAVMIIMYGSMLLLGGDPPQPMPRIR